MQAGAQAVTERGRQGIRLAGSEGVRGEIAGVKSLKRAFRFFPEFTNQYSFDNVVIDNLRRESKCLTCQQFVTIVEPCSHQAL